VQHSPFLQRLLARNISWHFGHSIPIARTPQGTESLKAEGKEVHAWIFLQGLEELGITAAPPTGFRFSQYHVDDILSNADILDIGSNCGFVACYCARKAALPKAREKYQ